MSAIFIDRVKRLLAGGKNLPERIKAALRRDLEKAEKGKANGLQQESPRN